MTDHATWTGVADLETLTALLPRRAVLAHRLERPVTPVEELDEYYGPAYAEGLYRDPVV